ncbi:hypothetical protein OG723_44545 (plasmid) [Streptomyces sp. NBC_01278]|uniref:hypothetical protein n=1 Tax=Streptomyces sp. NBC_01278 TaxID=2903809 RepID=UPI002E36AB9E|nr:hypothetical protein [Streptomyces sp. NBC_01278]
MVLHTAATAAEHASNWVFGWDALVALGTLILAVATAIVAGFTARLASRTRDLAKESTADQRAQWRPVLLPASTFMNPDMPPLSYFDGPGVLIRIRNAGRGPALHVRAQLDTPSSWDQEQERSPDQWSLGALAAGDEQELKFRQVGGFGPAAQLRLDYRDLAGRRYATVIILTSEADKETITRIHDTERFYDVRTWEDHSVTTLSDAVYPPHNLDDLSPQQR